MKYLLVFLVLINFGFSACSSGPHPCECYDNFQLGYYDLLSKKDKEFRQKCLDNIPTCSRTVCWTACKKSQGISDIGDRKKPYK